MTHHHHQPVMMGMSPEAAMPPYMAPPMGLMPGMAGPMMPPMAMAGPMMGMPPMMGMLHGGGSLPPGELNGHMMPETSAMQPHDAYTNGAGRLMYKHYNCRITLNRHVTIRLAWRAGQRVCCGGTNGDAVYAAWCTPWRSGSFVAGMCHC